MDTTLKRKNIDLPAEVWQKLSLAAVSQGKSLKAYVESLLLSKAKNIKISVSEPNEETLAAINEARSGIFAGEIDTTDMEAFIKSCE